MNLKDAIDASSHRVAYSKKWDLVGLPHAPYGNEEICILRGISFFKVDVVCGGHRRAPIPYTYKLTSRLPVKNLPWAIRRCILSSDPEWAPVEEEPAMVG